MSVIIRLEPITWCGLLLGTLTLQPFGFSQALPSSIRPFPTPSLSTDADSGMEESAP